MTDYSNDRDPFEKRSYGGVGDPDLGHDSTLYEREDRGRPEGPPRRTKKKRSGGWVKVIVLALVCSLVGGIAGSAFTAYRLKDQDLSLPSGGGGGQQVVVQPNEEMGQVEAVAKSAMPSVVGITVKTTQMTPFGPAETQGTGSGFIISEDGFILSNAHVVGSEGDTVNVLLSDGSEVPGQVVWSDSQMDLGLVKVEETGLSPLPLGDSNDLQIGELAVAIGNPLGLDFQRSVTAGVISGLNRNIGEVDGNYMDGLIQTDASINSGNSGGPLLNASGQVIGINTAKITSGEGMGFAIPISTVKTIIDQVMETGDYHVVALGVSAVSVEEVEKQLGVDFGTDHRGVMVASVGQGSPAEAAGIQRSDIILSLGDRELSSMAELRRALYEYQPGDTAQARVQRQGEVLDLEIEFTDYEVSQESFIE